MCLTMFFFVESIMPQKGTQEEGVAAVHTNGTHVEKDRTLEQIISMKHVASIFVMPASRTFTAKANYKLCGFLKFNMAKKHCFNRTNFQCRFRQIAVDYYICMLLLSFLWIIVLHRGFAIALFKNTLIWAGKISINLLSQISSKKAVYSKIFKIIHFGNLLVKFHLHSWFCSFLFYLKDYLIDYIMLKFHW